MDIDQAVADPHRGWVIREMHESLWPVVSRLGFHVADVLLHFRGSYVIYRTGGCEINCAYEPTSKDVRVSIILPGKETQNVWDVLKAIAPNEGWTEWPQNRAANAPNFGVSSEDGRPA